MGWAEGELFLVYGSTAQRARTLLFLNQKQNAGVFFFIPLLSISRTEEDLASSPVRICTFSFKLQKA